MTQWTIDGSGTRDSISIAMNSGGSPLIVLVRQHMHRQGIDRKALVERLLTGKNDSKKYRRVDEFLSRERFLPEPIARIAGVLGIPDGQLAVAWEAHEREQQERLAEALWQAKLKRMQRRGPHLWAILAKGYRPSLITVLGPEPFLLIRLPPDIVELPDYEQMQEVGRYARENWQKNGGSRPLSGYEYRRSLSEAFRFSLEGEYLGRLGRPWADPRTFLSIGGRKIETSSNGGFFFGGQRTESTAGRNGS